MLPSFLPNGQDNQLYFQPNPASRASLLRWVTDYSGGKMQPFKTVLIALSLGLGNLFATPQSQLAHADSLWALRGEPARARECLNAYTVAAQSLPADPAVWARLARIRY